MSAILSHHTAAYTTSTSNELLQMSHPIIETKNAPSWRLIPIDLVLVDKNRSLFGADK